VTTRRRNFAFSIGLAVIVAMSGFLLTAAPPQAVGTWEVTGTTHPLAARSGAATATLEDGSTFIAGGRLGDGTVADSVVVYNPLTNESTTVGNLSSPRVNAAAARLDDGRVLVVGGEVGDLLTADAEIFDLNTGTSTIAGSMVAPRKRHAAARLADGKVLVVGGKTVENATLATAEVFDPETGEFSSAGSMGTARAGASATLLIDNRVLVAGGHDGAQDLASAELFYPATQEFFPVETSLSLPRSGHTAVLLPHNGAVLISGGVAGETPVTDTDLFMPAMFPDPYTWSMGSFAEATPMHHPRSQAVGGPAGDDGYAFVAGGGMPEGEAYAFVTLKTDKDDYAPGEPALITGSGWEPGEEVELVFQEDPAVHPDYTMTLTADGDGNISDDTWAPEQHDANVRFYLMATGVTSQRRAQITFTDSVTSVTINSPTAGSPVSVAAGGNLTVSFSYVTSTTGTTTAVARLCQANNCNAGNTIVSANKSVTPGTNSDSIVLVVPGGTVAGSDYGVEVDVSNSTGGGSNLKTDRQNDSVTVTGIAATTTMVMSSVNASTYGNSVTFTATVTSTSTPTGSVNFVIDSTTVAGVAGPTTATTATWTYTTSSLTVGNHPVSANYVPSGAFANSNGSLSGGQIVSKRLATWTTNASGKTYGNPEPTPLTTGSGSNFVAADNVTATYGRALGESVAP
jgi:hypothetical protein